MTSHTFDEAVQRVAVQQRMARRRAWLAVLPPASVGLAFLAFGVRQLQRTSREAAVYEQQTEDYKAQVAELESARQNASTELAATEAQKKRTSEELSEVRAELAEEQAKLAAWREVTAQSLQQVGRKNPALVRNAVESAVEATPRGGAILPRIYVHIADEAQRSHTKQLTATLQEEGYLVPGIQRVKRSPRASQVRYFHHDEAGPAEQLADMLRAQGVRDISAQ